MKYAGKLFIVMGRLRSKSVLWASAAFLLFVIFSAVRIGAADLLSLSAQNEMYAWSTSAARPDISAVDNVSATLDKARLISPGNPDHYEDTARMALLRSGMPGVSDAERDALLSQGMEQIRAAIALRPVSAYSWATLLLLKRERGEYDAEFRHALERAVTLGPWEPQVQPVIADVGLSAWVALPGVEQEMVSKNFVRGMKRQPDTMIAVALSHLDDCKGARAKLNAGCTR